MTGDKRIESFPIRRTCPHKYLGANLNELTVSKKVEYNYQALVCEKSFVVEFGIFDRIRITNASTKHLFEPIPGASYLEESTQRVNLQCETIVILFMFLGRKSILSD